ncbi:MAG: endonuclease III [Candidatus Sumerlaeaceae bacterium]|nr:endonuclease III [Candidatus Sumerlaeaceae bacterium]
MSRKAELKARGAAINEALGRLYPEAKCSLGFESPFQLITATILSAQCTDERVNMVTPDLFRAFPTPKALAAADLVEIEGLIRTTGFFRNKAKSLKGMATALVRDHAGKVPGEMEALVKLPGVGRKTANVVLGNCFGVPGITVDTHMQRVTARLGLTRGTTPEKIERELMEIIPEKEWTLFSHRIICHGRAICNARKPACERCEVTGLCSYFAKFQVKAPKMAKSGLKSRGK